MVIMFQIRPPCKCSSPAIQSRSAPGLGFPPCQSASPWHVRLPSPHYPDALPRPAPPYHTILHRTAVFKNHAALQVGHLLGLGDRHLDNILLHKQHGHVVHLDFNVIFGRSGTPGMETNQTSH